MGNNKNPLSLDCLRRGTKLEKERHSNMDLNPIPVSFFFELRTRVHKRFLFITYYYILSEPKHPACRIEGECVWISLYIYSTSVF